MTSSCILAFQVTRPATFYSSSVYCTLANRKVFLRQITAGCKHNSECPVGHVAGNPCRGRFNSERTFYSSSVYCTLANRKVFLRQITAGCKHNSECPVGHVAGNPCRGRFNSERTVTSTSARVEDQSVNRAAYIKPESE